MRKLKVLISNNQKNVKIPSGMRLLIRRCCNAVLSYENFDHDAEVSVSFVSNNEIRRLNAEYREKNVPTDVLSFPLGENNQWDVNQETNAYMLGDIVISMEKAVEQANLYGHSLSREVAFLTVHSMFHLLGYDHEAGGLEAACMREKEEAVLAKLGLPREASYVDGNAF
ncbi:MAG TPA: rRNA maturation RNase YbeY [Firmicutes bacterium]|nr:rRNA maturation RNase YbeY [Bacillota bacterium]